MENAQIEQFEVTPVDTASTRWVRRFYNFVVAKGITDDTRKKAMMLHHAGETIFELSESVGGLDADTYAVAREKLTAYFTPRCNTEYEIFVFLQTQQLPDGGETLANKDGEIRSQIIKKCAMRKIRDKGLLESTIQHSFTMGNSVHATSTTSTSVNAVSSRPRQNSRNASQGASRDYGNHRRHDDRQGQHRPRHSTNSGGQGPSMNTRQRTPRRHANAVSRHSDARFCPGCGKSPHNRTEWASWGKITNLVANVEQPLSPTDADLCNDTHALNLSNTNTQHRNIVKPYVCTINDYYAVCPSHWKLTQALQ